LASFEKGENQDVGDASEKGENRNGKSLRGKLLELGTLEVGGEDQRPDKQRGQKDITEKGMLAGAARKGDTGSWRREHPHERIIGQ
jgi:hypothetical protein